MLKTAFCVTFCVFAIQLLFLLVLTVLLYWQWIMSYYAFPEEDPNKCELIFYSLEKQQFCGQNSLVYANILGYVLLVMLVEFTIFEWLARVLNNWENHRTQQR